MMSKQLSNHSAEVLALVKKINKEHTLAMDSAKAVQKAKSVAVKNAISVGKGLLRIKSKCKHGEWKEFFDDSKVASDGDLEATFGFGKVWAFKYMKAAKYPEQLKEIANESDGFNLNKAYAELSGATEEREKELIGQHSLGVDDEYYTPSEFVELARAVLGVIDVDPASNPVAQETVKASTYYTINNSGLDHPWVGNIFLNPPYDKKLIPLFAKKLVAECESGNVTGAVVLTNNGTDTRWYDTINSVSDCIGLTRERMKFEKDGVPQNNNNKGQVFFYRGNDPEGFKRQFRETCNCYDTDKGANDE